MLENLKNLWFRFRRRKDPKTEIDRIEADLKWRKTLFAIFKSESYPDFKEYLESQIFENLEALRIPLQSESLSFYSGKIEALNQLITQIEGQEEVIKTKESELRRLKNK